jgi:DNA-binding IclR family transcriptional regulator
MAGLDIVREAHPVLEGLAERTRETVNLGVHLGGLPWVYIDQVTGTRSVVAVSWIGRRTPLHCTSNGKVLLAFEPREDRERHLAEPLEQLAERTIVIRRAPDAARGSRSNGYAQTNRGAGGGPERGRRAGCARPTAGWWPPYR